MAILTLKDITLTYGDRALFDAISVGFKADQKVGVIGRNGAGKSTLLKAIAGQIALDQGSICRKREARIAYLPQEVVLNSEKSVFDEAFSLFQAQIDRNTQKSKLEALLATAPKDAADLLERYETLLRTAQPFDVIQAEKKTKETLGGLGFKDEQLSAPVSTLSIGWKMRIVLAKLLLEEADFYLFDEPTNHLDVVAKEWFIQFLKAAPFGYLLVSHDRHFLDNACSWIFELARGSGTLYHGNYSNYIVQHERQHAQQQAAYLQQQKEIARKQATIARFRASASKAKMAQSMSKQLDRIKRIEVDPPEPTIHLNFGTLARANRVALSIQNVSHRFGDKELLRNGSFQINRGQKVALVAPNGAGKSTLFNLITGSLALQEGTITFGNQVTYAFFEQDQTRALSPDKTILQELTETCPDAPLQTIQAYLGAFLFSQTDSQKQIGLLSGGEKNRVAMVKLLLQNANMLLLDEPTNHLDLPSKSVLLQALKQYPGTMLFVSHDHQFIQELATDILDLTPQRLVHYPGRYEEFLADQAKKQTNANTAPSCPETNLPISKPDPQTKPKKKGKGNPAKLERLIEQLEKKIKGHAEILSKEKFGTLAYKESEHAIELLQTELSQAMEEWEAILTS